MTTRLSPQHRAIFRVRLGPRYSYLSANPEVLKSLMLACEPVELPVVGTLVEQVKPDADECRRWLERWRSHGGLPLSPQEKRELNPMYLARVSAGIGSRDMLADMAADDRSCPWRRTRLGIVTTIKELENGSREPKVGELAWLSKALHVSLVKLVKDWLRWLRRPILDAEEPRVAVLRNELEELPRTTKETVTA